VMTTRVKKAAVFGGGASMTKRLLSPPLCFSLLPQRSWRAPPFALRTLTSGASEFSTEGSSHVFHRVPLLLGTHTRGSQQQQGEGDSGGGMVASHRLMLQAGLIRQVPVCPPAIPAVLARQTERQ